MISEHTNYLIKLSVAINMNIITRNERRDGKPGPFKA